MPPTITDRGDEMKTAWTEWSRNWGGEGYWRYGTDRDPMVCVPQDAHPGSLAYRLGYVYAHDTAEAIRVDEEVFGGAK